jgi:hypothetical protein
MAGAVGIGGLYGVHQPKGGVKLNGGSRGLGQFLGIDYASLRGDPGGFGGPFGELTKAGDVACHFGACEADRPVEGFPARGVEGDQTHHRMRHPLDLWPGLIDAEGGEPALAECE